MGSLDKMESLCSAIKKNDVETVRSLLSKNPELVNSCRPGSINGSTNDSGEDLSENVSLTPMWEAMLSGHVEIVEILLDFGADPDEPFLFEKNKLFGLTFLQSLAMQEYFWQCSQKVAQVLIRRGANVFTDFINKADFDNAPKSSFQMALEQGNVQYVEFLFLIRPQLQYTWIDFLKSPKLKQRKMLKLLIKYGLDTKYHNLRGRNRLHMVISQAIRNPELDIDVLGITEILLDAGVLVDDLDNHEQSALFYAIALQNFELVSLLVKRGANVNHISTFDRIGNFPLYLAVRRDNLHIVEFLLTKGAEINSRLEDGQTVMHVACFMRKEKTIQLLLKKGADIRVTTKGNTPFQALKPWEYKESDISCINLMIKEIAKKYFFYDFTINESDLDLMYDSPILKEYFETCLKELEQMQNTKFYPPYSYCCVLEMAKKIKKLANLTKNEDFVSEFETNLMAFPCYEDDLRRTWEEAMLSRDNSLIVELTLKSVFGNIFPDVVLRKFEKNLTAEDLFLS